MPRDTTTASIDVDGEILHFLKSKKSELQLKNYSEVLHHCIPELRNDAEAGNSDAPNDSTSNNEQPDSRTRRPPLIDADRVANDDKLASWLSGLSTDARKWLFEVLGSKVRIAHLSLAVRWRPTRA